MKGEILWLILISEVLETASTNMFGIGLYMEDFPFKFADNGESSIQSFNFTKREISHFKNKFFTNKFPAFKFRFKYESVGIKVPKVEIPFFPE